MKNLHRNHPTQLFGLTARERRGLLLFLFFMVSTWSAGKYLIYLSAKNQHMAQLSLQEEDWIGYSDSSEALHMQAKMPPLSAPAASRQVFHFNPNRLQSDSFVLLGFTPIVARNISNYRKKGGQFRNIEKMKAMYGIDTTLVNSLAGYMHFEEEMPSLVKQAVGFHSAGSRQPQRELPPAPPLDINTADSLAFLAIRGIGPGLCRRILSMRRRLGGYLTVSQLAELQVVPDSVFRMLQPQLKADQAAIQPIHLNTADYQTFRRHPLFDHATAQSILQYRKQHGPFETVQHLRRIRNLDAAKVEKLFPYLTADGVKE